jgi:hypothetical protein
VAEGLHQKTRITRKVAEEIFWAADTFRTRAEDAWSFLAEWLSSPLVELWWSFRAE